MVKKAAWSISHTHELSDPNFSTGTIEADQQLLRNLIGFYGVTEGIFFYCGFTQILSMGRRNKMTGVASNSSTFFAMNASELWHRCHQSDQA